MLSMVIVGITLPYVYIASIFTLISGSTGAEIYIITLVLMYVTMSSIPFTLTNINMIKKYPDKKIITFLKCQTILMAFFLVLGILLGFLYFSLNS